jgi:hypothetical protein
VTVQPDAALDLDANLRRELLEETGIHIDELDTNGLDGRVRRRHRAKTMAHQDATELRAESSNILATGRSLNCRTFAP